jgi:catechol 2,3-dioxygenase-like lactoylglutathione lyase family enzyme
MPIRKPNDNPPFRIVRVSHVELGVRDLAAARAFYVDCLGLLASNETADTLHLRGLEERNHHSIVLRRAREPRAAAIGFKVASEEDLDRAAFWFGRNNLPTSFPEIAHQGRTLRTADVHGVPVDFYFRMEQAGLACTAVHSSLRSPGNATHHGHTCAPLSMAVRARILD